MTDMLIRFGPSAGIEAAIDAGSLPKGMNMTDARTLRIRNLNDNFRTTLQGGKTFVTPGISALGAEFGARTLDAVRSFTEFSGDNDPYGEHDFGAIAIGGEKVFWKIDYYDLAMDFGSKDPADPAQTTRVLTILLAEEY